MSMMESVLGVVEEPMRESMLGVVKEPMTKSES